MYTLDLLEQEQASLALTGFDYTLAWQLGCAMQAVAAREALPVAITVSHGLDLVFSCLMPGATPDNLTWAARKRAVAHRFQRSSLALRLQCEEGDYDLNDAFSLPRSEFVASGGALPLILRGGVLVGTAAVSGLPDVEDHILVADAIRQLQG